MSKELLVSKVLIENSEGKFLVLQKSEDYDLKGGKWELPGGKIGDNLKEDRFDAGRREIQDETNLKLKELVDVVRTELEEFKEDEPVVNCWILHTDNFKGEITLSEEHKDYRWVEPCEFRNMDWHRDAGYSLPSMVYLEEYLNRDKSR